MIHNGLTPLEAFGGWRIVREVTPEYAKARLGELTAKLENDGYAVLNGEVLYVRRGCSSTGGQDPIGRWYVIENKPMRQRSYSRQVTCPVVT